MAQAREFSTAVNGSETGRNGFFDVYHHVNVIGRDAGVAGVMYMVCGERSSNEHPYSMQTLHHGAKFGQTHSHRF